MGWAERKHIPPWTVSGDSTAWLGVMPSSLRPDGQGECLLDFRVIGEVGGQGLCVLTDSNRRFDLRYLLGAMGADFIAQLFDGCYTVQVRTCDSQEPWQDVALFDED